jgi:hypothetical protein
MDFSLAIGLGGLVIAALSIIANVVIAYLNHLSNVARIRFGVVFEERFCVCKSLYIHLSRLRDSVQDFGSVRLTGTDPAAACKELRGCAENLRRTIRQNSFIFPDRIARQLDAAWITLKDSLYAVEDSASPQLLYPTHQSVHLAIAEIDQVVTRIEPYIRSE